MTSNFDAIDKRFKQRERLKYPPLDRPDMLIQGTLTKVVDLSLTGVKFMIPPQLNLTMKARYQLQIRFSDGTIFISKGVAVRKIGDLAAFMFDSPIPKRTLIKEFKRLEKKFGYAELKT